MYLEFDEGQKFSSSDNPEISSSHESFTDCGYILEDADLVVDIDTLPKETIRELIKTFNIKTQTVWTERGAHLYFKKPNSFRRKANSISALGFPIEFKHNKNTKAITIKRFGKLREIEYLGFREDLPDIFSINKKFFTVVGFGDGDGRNQAIYRLKMLYNNIPGWQKMLRFINEHIFDEPLPNDEFNLATRDEIIPKAEKNGEFVIADYLKRNLEYTSYAENFYFRPEGEEEFISDERLLIDIVYKVCGEVRTSYIDEVIKQMKYRAYKIPDDAVFNIKLKNGYIRDGQFIPIITKEFTPYSIDIDYDPNAERVQIVDDYLDHLTKNDEEYRRLLMECLGHTLITNPERNRILAKFFIFVGEGGNGKGTLLQIIKSILNTKNCASMDIKELSDERYLSSLKGKLANLGDDIQDQAINDKDMKMLKNITTSDYISTRELYKNATQIQFTASLIFTSNHLIKSFEKGKSFKRRVLWLPMYTQVKEEDKDPLFITKLTEKKALEYWIKLIVEGYMRLYKNNSFTRSKIVEDFNHQYHQENNPYLMYIDGMSADDFIGETVASVKSDVSNWCESNDVKFSNKMFINTLEEVLRVKGTGVAWINGKSTKIYQKID